MVLVWKVLTFVFLILFLITLTVHISSVLIGREMIDNEYNCSAKCFNIEPDGSYSYDFYTKICSCWLIDEIIHQEKLN